MLGFESCLLTQLSQNHPGGKHTRHYCTFRRNSLQDRQEAIPPALVLASVLASVLV
jgi:hypothetical protein